MNFLFWLAMHVARKSVYKLVAVPASLVPQLSASDRAQLNEAVERILPVASRRPGILNDAKTQGSARQYDLSRISVPTLLLSARDDLYKTLANAREAARLIPHARLVEFETGGHLLLGHAQDVWPTVAEFISAHEESPPVGAVANPQPSTISPNVPVAQGALEGV
jgi:pimeloyl-ACP methyl ester carboxylesterase